MGCRGGARSGRSEAANHPGCEEGGEVCGGGVFGVCGCGEGGGWGVGLGDGVVVRGEVSEHGGC